MNYYKLSRSAEDMDYAEIGPLFARLQDPNLIVIRHHDLFDVERRLRADWNRYVAGLIKEGAKNMFSALINRLRVSRTKAQLEALDDRLLADIGLYRSDIAAVARKLADTTTQPVEARNIVTNVAKVTELPAGFTGEAANTDEHKKAA